MTGFSKNIKGFKYLRNLKIERAVILLSYCRRVKLCISQGCKDEFLLVSLILNSSVWPCQLIPFSKKEKVYKKCEQFSILEQDSYSFLRIFHEYQTKSE